MRYYILLSILLSGCGQFHSAKDPRTVHGVDPILQPYVDEYITYKGSGLNYDIAIGFSDLSGNTNGLCTKFISGERQIQIDREWWDNYSHKYNRFTVIAHELGHCDLNRHHNTDTFSTGQPLSIMHPYTFIIFPEDMNYYMTELFNR